LCFFAAIDRVVVLRPQLGPSTLQERHTVLLYGKELLAAVDAKLLSTPALVFDGNGGGLIGAKTKRMEWYQQVMDGVECPLGPRVKDGALLHALLCSTLPVHGVPCIGFKKLPCGMDLHRDTSAPSC
jgi:hypothetical protein